MYPRYFNGNCPSTLLTVAINNVTICGDAEPRRTYLEALPRQTNGDGTSCFVPLLIREADAPHKSWWIAWKCSINICQFKGFKNPPTPFKMDKEGLSFFPPPHLYISSHELIHSMLFSKSTLGAAMPMGNILRDWGGEREWNTFLTMQKEKKSWYPITPKAITAH